MMTSLEYTEQLAVDLDAMGAELLTEHTIARVTEAAGRNAPVDVVNILRDTHAKYNVRTRALTVLVGHAIANR